VAGINATTLQGFLARGSQGQTAFDPDSKHLYMLDESKRMDLANIFKSLELRAPGIELSTFGNKQAADVL
jgi:hypothetical protein